MSLKLEGCFMKTCEDLFGHSQEEESEISLERMRSPILVHNRYLGTKKHLANHQNTKTPAKYLNIHYGQNVSIPTKLSQNLITRDGVQKWAFGR